MVKPFKRAKEESFWVQHHLLTQVLSVNCTQCVQGDINEADVSDCNQHCQKGWSAQDMLQLSAVGQGGWSPKYLVSGSAQAIPEEHQTPPFLSLPFLSHSECQPCPLLQQHIWALGALGQAKGSLSPGSGCGFVTLSVAAVTLAVTPCSACLASMGNTQHSPWEARKEMSLSSSDFSRRGWTSGFGLLKNNPFCFHHHHGLLKHPKHFPLWQVLLSHKGKAAAFWRSAGWVSHPNFGSMWLGFTIEKPNFD